MKFQNPSLNFFLNGRKDVRTHKPNPICSPLFQSWGHNHFFFKFAPGILLVILYQMTKFEASSCNTFQDIMVTNFQSPNLQREIIKKK